VVPYFQPILSVETQTICAVEALGRHEVDGEVHSLGPLFFDRNLDPGFQEFRWGIDRILRAAALLTFAQKAAPEQRLFLNVNPKFMLDHLQTRPHERPWTLKAIEETGVDPRRVVIELTEHTVGPEIGSLRRLVDQYREFGCSVAVDDVGAEASNLDRIGYFEPDIIKIDANLLRRSLAERAFEDVLSGLRTIADRLGASLLFEGVETEGELAQSLRFGARYLQGWLFSQAESQFADLSMYKTFLRKSLVDFGAGLAQANGDRDRALGTIVHLLSKGFPNLTTDFGVTTLDTATLGPWDGLACRVFLTDRRGFQVSPNYTPGPDGWTADPAKVGSCLTARPYFGGRGNPTKAGARPWSVSDPYYDVNDRRRIRTFGRQIGADLVLFVDVPDVENPPQNH